MSKHLISIGNIWQNHTIFPLLHTVVVAAKYTIRNFTYVLHLILTYIWTNILILHCPQVKNYLIIRIEIGKEMGADKKNGKFCRYTTVSFHSPLLSCTLSNPTKWIIRKSKSMFSQRVQKMKNFSDNANQRQFLLFISYIYYVWLKLQTVGKAVIQKTYQRTRAKRKRITSSP